MTAVVVPDSIVPIVGWRRWLVWGMSDPDSANPEIRLGSVPKVDCRWFPNKATPAQCRKQEVCRNAPQEGCTCGYYGLSTKAFREWFTAGAFPPFVVVGRVSMWGKVIVCQRGWRSQFAYPKELFLPRDVWRSPTYERYLDALSVYGVPVAGRSMYEIESLLGAAGS